MSEVCQEAPAATIAYHTLFRGSQRLLQDVLAKFNQKARKKQPVIQADDRNLTKNNAIEVISWTAQCMKLESF